MGVGRKQKKAMEDTPQTHTHMLYMHEWDFTVNFILYIVYADLKNWHLKNLHTHCVEKFKVLLLMDRRNYQ